MVLTDLRDCFKDETIYILGTGPTLSLFPKDYFRNKKCILLNNAYKIIGNNGPVGLFHSIDYLFDAGSIGKVLPHRSSELIKYPIVKVSSRTFDIVSRRSFPFYFYHYSHQIESFDPNVITNKIYYTKDGSSLHAALQVANIIGASTVFICGCDARTFSGHHYGTPPDDRFRSVEVVRRDYDSYTSGGVKLIKLLRQKGIVINYLSPLIGYNSLEYQFEQFSKGPWG